MILYLDASALVKRYVAELGSPEVISAISLSQMSGTSIVSRAEIAAALGKAVRMGVANRQLIELSLIQFRQDWPRLIRIQTSEVLLARAEMLAWDLGLRGFDAVHLASALVWNESLDQEIMFATYDRHLWQAAHSSGLTCFPENLPRLLNR